ncbi:MBL fold metallo-hydrolase [Nocardioides sp.]|uniref:MBL fold metallo-hydrolase n=1 Tax=Nocardioides sp. TaxID=35761 RepID=UPI003D147627
MTNQPTASGLPSPLDQPTDLNDYSLSGAFPVGGLTVHHISDGLAFGPRRSWFTGIDPEDWMPTLGLTDPDTPFPLNFGVFVIEGSEGITLVDSGFGPAAEGIPGIRGGNELMARLSEIGVQPSDVVHIVQSHCHGDHCGQLLTQTASGARLTFPEAVVHIHQAEVEHWTGPATDGHPMAPKIRETLEVVGAAGKLSTFTAISSITPGVVALPMPGHTPGHTCVLVSDGGESCILVGDLAHHPVHFENHGWVHELEHDLDQSLVSRAALCEMAIGLDAIVTAPHMPVLTLGKLHRDESGHVRWAAVPSTRTDG